MAKNKMWVVAQEPEPKPKSRPTGAGPMGPEELAEYQKMLTRARTYADGRKKASRRACRGNSAGRAR